MAAMKHANRCSLFPLRASLLTLTLGAANDRKWRFKIISGRSLYDRNRCITAAQACAATIGNGSVAAPRLALGKDIYQPSSVLLQGWADDCSLPEPAVIANLVDTSAAFLPPGAPLLQSTQIGPARHLELMRVRPSS
jgi:hypothetical protein